MRQAFIVTCFLLSATFAVSQPVALNAPAGDRAYSESAHYIVLHTGETIVGSVEAFPSTGIPEFAVANGTRYELGQIRAFGTSDGEFAVASGSRSRPLLLIKRESGRMNIYESLDHFADGGMRYMQVGDGQLSIMTSANLRAAMLGHDDALVHLDRERRYGNIGLAAMIGGAAIVAAGTVIELSDIQGPSGVLIAGSGVMFAVAVNAIVPGLQGKARRDAVREFNR